VLNSGFRPKNDRPLTEDGAIWSARACSRFSPAQLAAPQREAGRIARRKTCSSIRAFRNPFTSPPACYGPPSPSGLRRDMQAAALQKGAAIPISNLAGIPSLARSNNDKGLRRARQSSWQQASLIPMLTPHHLPLPRPPLTIHYSPLTTSRSPSTNAAPRIPHPPLTTHHSLFTTYHLLLTTYHLLLTTYHLLLTTYHSPPPAANLITLPPCTIALSAYIIAVSVERAE